MDKKYRFKWTERQTAIAKRKVNVDLNDANFALNLKYGYILTSPIRVDLEGFSKTPFREIVIRYCNDKYISVLRAHVRQVEYSERNVITTIRLKNKTIEACRQLALLHDLQDESAVISKVIDLLVDDYLNKKLV